VPQHHRVVFRSNLNERVFTDALNQVLLLVLALVLVGIEHVLKERVMTHFAQPFVVVGVREQCIETEADQEWLAHLLCMLTYILV